MLHCLNADKSKEFRDFFRESDYTMEALQLRFTSTDIPTLHLLKLYLLGVPLKPSRLNILCRWFWIGAPVERAMASEFIPERMITLFLEAGALATEGSQLKSNVRITPFAQYLVLSDHAVVRTGNLSADTILWPNPSTLLCYYLSIRAPVERTLDLGAGTGILGLAAAPHSTRVVATDLNSRAREFCLFNAALNGVSNIEFRQGSAFDPVRGERFDLILANPPFFVTPSVRRVYSDNSMELDGFCKMLIREAPEHLNENGYCQMLVEWVELQGQPWRDRLNEWFGGLGCDAWVMAYYMRPAADYAMIRVQEGGDGAYDLVAQTALIAEWQGYLESQHVEMIYGGMIVLRKRKGRNWIRIEELPSHPARPFGEFLRRTCGNRDALEAIASDDELLAMRPAVPASARLHRQFAISPEGLKLTSVDLQLTEGLPYSFALQPEVADFVARCDGQRTLAEIADQTTATLSVDPALVRRECCAVVRRLADRGMILL
jgi:methylase of polypeptide subunit release factors